ncbi:MAG: HNH endonuclease [Firmicutes bacterium HGW-Firmicutes-10]|nr:MAG: HNH endonuclease [Firmicutes bacterium HGW-Firmicutes-10]
MTKYQTLSYFYKSPEWRSLRQTLMIQRSHPVKGLVCEHCKEVILKDIDCIAHHIKELTLSNVHDATIALNPGNILLVHHRCHNEIHTRFGHQSPQKVYLVYGPPLAGKTSYVKASKGRKDIVLDLDELYRAITLLPNYEKPSELSLNIFQIRDLLLDQIKTRTGKWSQAWIIGGYPNFVERERLAQQLGAEIIFIEATQEECINRLLQDRDKQFVQQDWLNYIHDWFLRFSPTPPRSEFQGTESGTGEGTSDARRPKF